MTRPFFMLYNFYKLCNLGGGVVGTAKENKWDRFQLDKVPASLSRRLIGRLGVNWKPKHYITSPRCKICRCPARCEVEELLYVGAEYQDIAAWLKHIGYPNITPTDVSKHYKEHCNVQREVEERGIARYVSEVRKHEAQGLAQEFKNINGEELVSFIINLFAERELKPEDISVTQALKAASLQQKSGSMSGKDPILQVYIQQANVMLEQDEPEAIEGEVEDAGQDQG